MSPKKSPNDLSADELRRLLVEKRRSERQQRIERFRKTGRVVRVVPETEDRTLEAMRTDQLEDDSDTDGKLHGGRKRLFDRILLTVEILAVAGLLFVLFNGVGIIRELNREVAEALALPSATSTPLVHAVVLPSGHTPPDLEGGAKPNEAEIPDHLRPLVQSLASIPIPTTSPQQAVRIRIPAIDVNASVVQGDGWEQLKKGVGQHIGSANPGQDGNLILSAHNDIFGEIFRHLDELQPGDEVLVSTQQRTYTYTITRIQIVEPIRVDLMDATSYPALTLISCYPYLIDNQRIVVQASLNN